MTFDRSHICGGRITDFNRLNNFPVFTYISSGGTQYQICNAYLSGWHKVTPVEPMISPKVYTSNGREVGGTNLCLALYFRIFIQLQQRVNSKKEPLQDYTPSVVDNTNRYGFLYNSAAHIASINTINLSYYNSNNELTLFKGNDLLLTSLPNFVSSWSYGATGQSEEDKAESIRVRNLLNSELSNLPSFVPNGYTQSQFNDASCFLNFYNNTAVDGLYNTYEKLGDKKIYRVPNVFNLIKNEYLDYNWISPTSFKTDTLQIVNQSDFDITKPEVTVLFRMISPYIWDPETDRIGFPPLFVPFYLAMSDYNKSYDGFMYQCVYGVSEVSS